ncbi:MAG: hypothetical protein QXP80_06280 [Zestosphaera sp.]
MSHVVLNFLYRLRMYATGRVKGRGLPQNLLRVVVSIPDYFERLWSYTYRKVLDDVKVLPLRSRDIESSLSYKLVGTAVTPPALYHPMEEVKSFFKEGTIQRSVKYSNLAESLIVNTTLLVSSSLQELQRSLERSILTSSLLAGFLVTIALLFLVLYLT